VNTSCLMELAVGAKMTKGAADLTMTVLDAAGHVVTTITAQANKPSITRVVYMAAGTYTMKYTTSAGILASDLNFSLISCVLSDNIGPFAGSSSSGGSGGTVTYTYTGSTNTTVNSDIYWF